jgi:pimeloyl-ACP methyl ester carboxylesterase
VSPHEREVAVYVHGLWLNGGESLLLRRRLERGFGLTVHAFHYPSVSCCVADIVERLQAFVAGIRARRMHFIGHSLGGIVVHRFLERFPDQPPGRVVFLGTPCVRCRAAQSASRFPLISRMIGRAVAEELLCDRERRWDLDRELGIIAGTQPLGLGRFFAHFEEPSDGTVAVSETRLPGATDHITLPVSHMGMLLAPRVAHETGYFLEHGYFSLHGGRVRPQERRRAVS